MVPRAFAALPRRTSELLPSEAPYWKLRLLRRGEGGETPPRTQQLQAGELVVEMGGDYGWLVMDSDG